MNKFFNSFPAEQKYQLRYEDLALQPERIAKELCDFIGVDFEPAMLKFWQHQHHVGRCNIATRSMIRRYRGESAGSSKELLTVNERHGNHYDELGLSIKLDLRWQEELSEEQQKTFDRIAGEINLPFAH